MYIPKNPTTRGTHHRSHKAHHELLDNPITYEIILMLAVCSIAMLLVGIIRCLQAYIGPDDDDDYNCNDYEYQQEYDEDARPWSLTLTADGDLVDDESCGKKGRQYGTFWEPAHGKWYSADGVELSYDEWVETIYDPLD